MTEQRCSVCKIDQLARRVSEWNRDGWLVASIVSWTVGDQTFVAAILNRTRKQLTADQMDEISRRHHER